MVAGGKFGFMGGGQEQTAAEPRCIRVVVVSFNTRDLTVRCVRALRRSKGVNLSLCVVDNASEDGSVEALRRLDPTLEVLALSQNIGFGAANNRGVGDPRFPFVALVNSDAFVTEHTLSALREYLEAHPRVGIVGPRLFNADGSPQPCWFPFPGPLRAWAENLGVCGVLKLLRRSVGRATRPVSARVDWVSGACLMVRGEVWRASRGFDEQFFLYSEETDWQRRVCDLGWEIHGVAEAEATHWGGASGMGSGTGSKGATREFFWEGVDRYFRVHFGWSGAVCLRAATAVGAALRVTGCVLGCNWNGAVHWGGIARRQCTQPIPASRRRFRNPTPVWSGHGNGGETGQRNFQKRTGGGR